MHAIAHNVRGVAKRTHKWVPTRARVHRAREPGARARDGVDDDDNAGGDNDDDDFGAEEKGFTGDLFERLLMRGGLDAFDPDDADEAEDPVNDIDLAAFITAGVKSLHASGHLAPLAHAIPERHQRAIHDALVRA